MSSDIYLKFGKHAGERLQDVPLKYFAWLLTKYTGKSLTKEQLETEAIRRGCTKRNGHWGIERTRTHLNPSISSAIFDIGVKHNLYGIDPFGDIELKEDWKGEEYEDYYHDF